MIRRDNPGWPSWGSYTSRMGHVSCPATAGVEAVLAFGKGRCEPPQPIHAAKKVLAEAHRWTDPSLAVVKILSEYQ